MNLPRPLREQMDACRAGSDDLALPELAELAAALARDAHLADELAERQRFDRAVAATLQQGEVPPGLLARLLTAADEQADKLAAEPAAPLVHKPENARFRFSRRQWLAAAGATAASLLAGVAMWRWSRRPVVVGQAELAQAVPTWLQEVRASSAWESGELPPDYPLDRAVAATPRRWRALPVSGRGWRGAAVAADFAAGPQRPLAMLFIVRTAARFQVQTTPAALGGMSGGPSVRAWQKSSSNVLYVLAVEEEGGQRLDHFLRSVTVG